MYNDDEGLSKEDLTWYDSIIDMNSTLYYYDIGYACFTGYAHEVWQ